MYDDGCPTETFNDVLAEPNESAAYTALQEAYRHGTIKPKWVHKDAFPTCARFVALMAYDWGVRPRLEHVWEFDDPDARLDVFSYFLEYEAALPPEGAFVGRHACVALVRAYAAGVEPRTDHFRMFNVRDDQRGYLYILKTAYVSGLPPSYEDHIARAFTESTFASVALISAWTHGLAPSYDHFQEYEPCIWTLQKAYAFGLEPRVSYLRAIWGKGEGYAAALRHAYEAGAKPSRDDVVSACSDAWKAAYEHGLVALPEDGGGETTRAFGRIQQTYARAVRVFELCTTGLPVEVCESIIGKLSPKDWYSDGKLCSETSK